MYNCAQVALASKDVYKKMFWVQSLMDAAALIVAPTNYHHTTNRSSRDTILSHIIILNYQKTTTFLSGPAFSPNSVKFVLCCHQMVQTALRPVLGSW